jgi:hypothetical protein
MHPKKVEEQFFSLASAFEEPTRETAVEELHATAYRLGLLEFGKLPRERFQVHLESPILIASRSIDQPFLVR